MCKYIHHLSKEAITNRLVSLAGACCPNEALIIPCSYYNPAKHRHVSEK